MILDGSFDLDLFFKEGSLVEGRWELKVEFVKVLGFF